MGMEVFHGRNGNSGNSVVVSIGAHCQPGRSSWSTLYNLLSRAISKSLPELCWGCTLPGFWWQVSHSPMWLNPCQRQILENVQGVTKVGVKRMDYLVSCNKQRSRHQFQQAQTCRERPDKGKIKSFADLPCGSLWRGSIPWEIRPVLWESDCRLFGSHTWPFKGWHDNWFGWWAPVGRLAEYLHQVDFWL